LLRAAVQVGGAPAGGHQLRGDRLLLDRRLLQRGQPHRRPRRPGDHAHGACGRRHRGVRLRLGPRRVLALSADPAGAGRGRADHHLRRDRRRGPGLPVVQHLPGDGVPGRHRRAGAGRGATHNGRDRAPGAGAGGHGRHLRDRDAVGDDPGGQLQAHRQARVPDGADPPPLRAQGLAGAARDRALLDHFGGPGAGRPGNAEGALMAVTADSRMFESTRQATRLDAIEGRYGGWRVGVAVALAAFGVVMAASASIAVAGNLGQGPFHYLVKHVVFLAVGIALCGVAMRTDLKLVEKYPRALLAGCVLLLLLVFIPGLGYSVNGARRWISFRVANFQVVEAAKVLYLVWLASYLVRFRDEVNATWAAMLKPIG